MGLVSATDRIQAFGSLTGRLGVAFDNVLIYGKGGGAVASNKISVNVLGLSASDTQTHFGYTVGGGVEWGFVPNWSVKGEYLWAHYESQNYFVSQFPPGFASGSFDVNRQGRLQLPLWMGRAGHCALLTAEGTMAVTASTAVPASSRIPRRTSSLSPVRH